jgi:hypothetical protein
VSAVTSKPPADRRRPGDPDDLAWIPMWAADPADYLGSEGGGVGGPEAMHCPPTPVTVCIDTYRNSANSLATAADHARSFTPEACPLAVAARDLRPRVSRRGIADTYPTHELKEVRYRWCGLKFLLVGWRARFHSVCHVFNGGVDHTVALPAI